MTLFQKKCYKAVLEGNREILVNAATTAAMPSLVNIQMELRKCCNHPYLIKGIEETETRSLSARHACRDVRWPASLDVTRHRDARIAQHNTAQPPIRVTHPGTCS